ncbi:UvrD-helicase domain-containing protein [Candidatus Saccharibacteria bacterium]|nr:UvrD-helicase domain-containing protein [Candidatus Saccharibacteria bacterium]
MAYKMVDDLQDFLCALEKMYCERYVSFSELEKMRDLMLPIPKGREAKKMAKKIKFYLNKREKLNAKFIASEQKKVFEVEGNFLDAEQIAAVVACDDAELILASAGSGKSASLMGKVNHLVRDLGMPAEEILVIAFTRKVVKELNERMGKSGVEICTFHSFGNKIIRNLNVGAELKLVPDGFLEQVAEKFLKSVDVKWFGSKDNFRKLLVSTLQLQKNEQVTLKEFGERILKMKDEKERARAKKFFEIYSKFVRVYGKILRDNRLYDFSDMLSWATRIIEKMPRGELKYKYVLVDEVQDLSLSKSLLLKAILDNCQDAKLFAVGDDWQSIYRFAGSNLGVLKDFEKNFGRFTYRGVIRRTYRFGQPTAWVSEYFVRRNKEQSKKKVLTLKSKRTPVEICLGDSKRGVPEDYEAVDGSLQKLFLELGAKLFEKNIQVISRYNKDVYRLVDFKTCKYKNARILEEKEDGVKLGWKIAGVSKELTVNFCSMHKSKGITRDIVFVINMNEGEKGMPSTRADEPILATMLAKPDKFPLAEERRLFYVAMTRAKEKTFIVAERKKVSRFVREIAKNLSSEIMEELE